MSFRKYGNKWLLYTVSMVLGLTVLVICWSLHREHKAYDAHLVAEADQAARDVPNPQGFSITLGPGIYEDLADKYRLIVIFMIVFLIGKSAAFQKRFTTWALEKLSWAAYVGALFLVLYQFWQLFEKKAHRWESLGSTNEPLDSLMRSATIWDWLCLSLVLILLVIQFMDLFWSDPEKMHQEVIESAKI